MEGSDLSTAVQSDKSFHCLLIKVVDTVKYHSVNKDIGNTVRLQLR